ncbi:MAG TPA: hypothetical protein DC054_06260 [Blastocatellia bacterium]|nr:hypothetical protein [Blastocatellia bacterium]
MQIKRSQNAFVAAVCLIASAMAPPALGQQAAVGDWSVVQSLSPDEQIVVSLKSGKEVKGKFLDAGGNEITILRKGKHESFAKDTVAQIHQVKGKAKKGQWALIGAGVGAAGGFLFGETRRNRVLIYQAR